MTNKITVKLENFQSISEAELEFVKGINVIVGEGNSGKSATLRAIKGAVTNPKGSQKYIKNGKANLSVNISYLGNDITWTRTSKEIKYIINGEEYQKVGNSNLTKILDKSGFVLNDNDKLMNVEGELELPFPFDKNPAELFKLFEKSIFCVSDSALILKAIKADEDTINKDKTDAKYELDRFNNKLKALKELEEVVDIDKIKKGKITLEELFFQLDKMKVNINKVSEGIEASKKLKTFKEEITDIDVNEYVRLCKNVEKLQNNKVQINILNKTKDEVEVKDLNNYNKLKSDIIKLEEIKELLSNTKQLDEVTINIDLESYIKKLDDYNKLNKLVRRCKELTKEVEEVKNKQATLKEELSKFKVCPLCGKEL